SITTIEVEAERPPRLRLRFVDTLPGFGLRSYRIFRGPARAADDLRVTSGKDWIENRHWRVSASPDGRIQIVRRADGTTIDDAIRIASEGDRGDEYNFDPVPDSAPIERPSRVGVRVERGGEAAASLVLKMSYRIPESLTADRTARSKKTVTLPVTLRIR